MTGNSFIKNIRVALGGSISALGLSYILSVLLNLTGAKSSIIAGSGIVSLVVGTFLVGKFSKFEIKPYLGFLIGLFYGWLSLLFRMDFLLLVIKRGLLSLLIVLFISPLPVMIVSFLTLWVTLKFVKKE